VCDALEAHGLSSTDLALVAVAVGISVGWLVVLATIRFLRRPREPAPGPPTLDLGPEPPAVANVLVNGFRVTRDAVPATLLDLAARGIVEIERVGPDGCQCRLRRAPEHPLAAYERRVLEVLRKKASGGVVPAQALTTGPADESRRWWRSFKKEVVADCQGRGLTRDIWSRGLLIALAVPLVLPTVLLALAFGEGGLYGYGAGAAVFLGGISSRRRQRDTPAGLEAASRWIGLREALEQDEAFPTAPAIAVALWERHLAYGAALGVAAGAVRSIPMGAESDTRAWSSYGGRWRQVRVAYPHVWPLGWGLHPAAALLRAVVLAAVAGGVAYALVTIANEDVLDGTGSLEPAVLAAAIAAFSLLTLGALVLGGRSLPDLWSRAEVVGEVLRLRTHGSEDKRRCYVAVDDGTTTKVRAWLVKPELYSRLEQNRVIAASLTPRLAYVRSIRTAGPMDYAAADSAGTAFSNTSSPSRASTPIASPSPKPPSSSAFASGFSTRRWRARLSGLAP
jgi:hypothetical protein